VAEDRVIRASVLLLVCAAAAGCTEIRSQTHTYATLAEAREAGAVEQGWLLDGLPPGTYEIRVAYVPGGREGWGLFNFPPGERDHLVRLLAPDPIDVEGIRMTIPARIEWWPIVLRGPLDPEQLTLTGLTAYRTTDGAFVIAVNWSQGRAYYWKAEGGHERVRPRPATAPTKQ
jgi:hypothetical protein